MVGADINWHLLVEALGHYGRKGFVQTDLPWHARSEVVNVTCPHQDAAFQLPGHGTLVGSAEQSFMQAQFDGKLEKGRWVALTPCFRNEPTYDRLHLPYFMKVELYSNDDCHEGLDLEFAEIARSFMQLHSPLPVEIVTTDIGYDLEIAGIEVGSYSTRTYEGFTWTCGTGLAEPRFSTAIRSKD